jgi:hypothetical protein
MDKNCCDALTSMTRKLVKYIGISEDENADDLYPLKVPESLAVDNKGKRKIEEVLNYHANFQKLTKYVEEIANVVGADAATNYPSKMPDSLNEEDGGEEREIYHASDWYGYFFDIFEESIGQFPIDFDIEEDAFKPANIAEMLGEIYGQLLEINATATETKAVSAHTLMEIGLTKIYAAKSWEGIKCLTTFFECYDEKEIPLPMTFDPNLIPEVDEGSDAGEGFDILQLLKTSPEDKPYKIKVRSEQAQSQYLKNEELKIRAAEIIKAVFWQNISEDPRVARQQLLNLLNTGSDLAKSFYQYKHQNNDRTGDWKEFKSDIEKDWKEEDTLVGATQEKKEEEDKKKLPKIKELKFNNS